MLLSNQGARLHAVSLSGSVQTAVMVLADLGRKITSALRSLSNATIINEEVTWNQSDVDQCDRHELSSAQNLTVCLPVCLSGVECHAEGGVCCSAGGRRQHQTGQAAERECQVSSLSPGPGPLNLI